jgi:ribosomal protein L28
MPASCELCAKQTTFGRNIRHKSTGRWQRKASRTPRQFRANLQQQTIYRDGKKVSLRLCTRCIRTSLKTMGAPIKVAVTKAAPEA